MKKPKPSRRRTPPRRKPRTKPRGTHRGRNGGTLNTGGNFGGGRPSNDFRQACREALDRVDAVGIAVTIARNTKKAARDRLAALAWLADRGWGKAAQPVTGEGDGPIQADITVRYA